MAKAAKQPSDYTLTLELSRDEAETLLFVCGSISGATKTPRQHTNAIYDALGEAGVATIFPPASGSINFDGAPNE